MNKSKENKKSFINSDSFPGLLLITATAAALIIANSPLNSMYSYFIYDLKLGEEFNFHFFVNDALMALFFLVVGCEIKRELIYGKLSSVKQASFPVLCAVGGMALPALIFTIFNFKSRFEIGAGIPLSTDIAFAMGIFAILQDKLSQSLKVFLLTLAVVDDLLSIVIIGVFYSSGIRISGIIATVILTAVLFCIRYINKENRIYPYVIIGILLWCAVFYSGIHSTLSGVILAFTIPVYDEDNRYVDINFKIYHKLEPYSNFLILPLFAFVNTGIRIIGNMNFSSDFPLMTGIILGLVIGKPLGIMLFGYLGKLFKVSDKPQNTSWYDVFIVSVIAGIGFTMSLFVAEIAFKNEEVEIGASKISILIAAAISTAASFTLSFFKRSSSHKVK